MGSSVVYEKVPPAREISAKYFSGPARIARDTRPVVTVLRSKGDDGPPPPVSFPSENELLDIARGGETQVFEFKAQGIDARTICREIGAMLSTRFGGLIFYGIVTTARLLDPILISKRWIKESRMLCEILLTLDLRSTS